MENTTNPKQRKEDKRKEEENKLVISYLTIRKLVGILGIALPVILILSSYFLKDCTGFQNSISDYHNTISRDLFVGILCAIALFLSAYNGYNTLDKIVAKFAGILGIVVATIPTTVKASSCTIYANLGCDQSSCYYLPEWLAIVHFTAAASFLLLLAYFSFFLFTKSDKNKKDLGKAKNWRNTIYRTCGVVIFLCLAGLGLYYLLTDPADRIIIDEQYKPVLIGEIVALWAFGFSWLVKGEAIGFLRD